MPTADQADASSLPDTSEAPPWTLAPEAILDRFETSEDGLSQEKAQQRRATHGPNRLRQIQHRSVWNILWDQIKSLIMLLLAAAMVLSFVTGQTVEGIAVAVVIIANAAIGFVTEWRAVRSMESLQELGSVEVTVRRAGTEETVPADDLVPGDVVVIDGGDVIAADLRLIDVAELALDESALTGESVPVAKETATLDDETPLAERTNMAYKGTAVTRGQGVGVVVATGMDTEIGEISSMVEAAGQEATPLERKLARLGRKLVWLTLGVAACVTLAGVLAGRDLALMLETGIALAVAAVPEGLPIVATVALAYGLYRMLQRNALIRRLSSVETLGATTVICTDKTGTLTENQMTVRQITTADGPVEVRRDDGDVTFTRDDAARDPDEDEPLRQAIEVGVLCNGARLPDDGDDHEGTGDPMEIALLALGRRAGYDRADLLDRWPEVRVESFSRDTKMMAAFHETDDGILVAVKGAPEAVLEACTRHQTPDGPADLDEDARQEWASRNETMAEDGLRVLALARKIVDTSDAAPYEDLCLIGLVGLLDPPRSDVRDAIAHCQEAGIRVVMVTGDHPATAQYVGAELGLIDDNDALVVQGQDFEGLNDGDGDRERFLKAPIFARVTPEQKLTLIDLHQEHDAIVAMTGDGVNDAAALKSADIGIAMGRRGTDVAKEAADMVLQDDAFGTIVAAIEQGRVIFENIRKFVIYLLSGNVGEILAVGAAAAVGAALPLLPLQILYLNLINDVFPALALGVGRSSGQVMRQPPRDPTTPIITRASWAAIGGYGVVIAVAVLAAFAYAIRGLELPAEQATTIAFLGLSLARLLHVFNMRRPGSGLIRNEVVRNPFVWGAFAVCLGLLALALYVPVLARVLTLTPPSAEGWLVIVLASLFPLVAGQLFLLIQRVRHAEEP